MVDKKPPQVLVRSIERAADLLLALGSGPMDLGELSSSVALSKATAHRLLSTMKAKHLVTQSPITGQYGLGPATFTLVSGIVPGMGSFAFDADGILADLRDATSETVTIHIRVGAARMCIEELPSRHAIRYTAGIGEMVPIHVGSAGKALLAFLPADHRDRILNSLRLTPITAQTIIDIDHLREELSRIARRGLAFSRGERIQGASAVTAPIFDRNHSVVAVLSILGPSSRLDDDALTQAGELVRRAADEVTSRVFGLAVGTMDSEDGLEKQVPGGGK